MVAATVQLAGQALEALQHTPPPNWPRDYTGYSSRGRRYLPSSSAFAEPRHCYVLSDWPGLSLEAAERPVPEP